MHIQVQNYSSITNLHALWDSVILSQYDAIQLPLSDSSWELLGNDSDRLRKLYPHTLINPLANSVDAWTEESFKIVKEHVYSGMRQQESLEGPWITQPSKEYLEESLKISERQITLGGYRLAQVLADIYKSRNTIEIHESLDTSDGPTTMIQSSGFLSE